MNTNNHSGYDPAKEDRYEQKYGEDPNIAERNAKTAEDRISPARTYFERTLEKATKIIHGDGDKSTTYLPSGTKFKDFAVFEAQKMIMVYFTYLKFSNEGNPGVMKVADKFWRYTGTMGQWVEVHHE